MMGKDIERILSGIDSVKEAAVNSVDSLAGSTAYQISVIGSSEFPVPLYPSSFTNPIDSAMSGMGGDCGNMDSLRNGLYTDTTAFNNSYGSPWTELDRLKDAVNSVTSFGNGHNPMNWVGEKAALLGLINKVVSAAVDARWAIMHFHDYIQRGYDHEFNGDVPSITFQDGKGNSTVGNINHDYADNVHIPKPPNYEF